jgi:hypothetical protein
MVSAKSAKARTVGAKARTVIKGAQLPHKRTFQRVIAHNFRAERRMKDARARMLSQVLNGNKKNKVVEKIAYFENNTTSDLIRANTDLFIEIMAYGAYRAELTRSSSLIDSALYTGAEGAQVAQIDAEINALSQEYKEREEIINRIDEGAPKLRREYLFANRRANIHARLIKKIARVVDVGTGALKLYFENYKMREVRAVLWELRAYDKDVPLFLRDAGTAFNFFNIRRISGSAQVKRASQRKERARFLSNHIKREASALLAKAQAQRAQEGAQ